MSVHSLSFQKNGSSGTLSLPPDLLTTDTSLCPPAYLPDYVQPEGASQLAP